MKVYLHTEVKYIVFVTDAIYLFRRIYKHKKKKERTNINICKYKYIIYIYIHDVPEASSRPEGWISRAQNGTRR